MLIHFFRAIFVVLVLCWDFPIGLEQFSKASLDVVPLQHKTFVLVIIVIGLKGVSYMQVRLSFFIETKHLRECGLVGQ